MIVLWGGNRMVDCVALLSWQDRAVMTVASRPVRVDFSVPPSLGVDAPSFEIVANQVVSPARPPKELAIRESPDAVAILWTELALVTAQEIGTDEATGTPIVLLHADLRLLGMNVFDDAAGIHVGGALVARTSFSRCSTAITLR